jgi:hypothetical protein
LLPSRYDPIRFGYWRHRKNGSIETYDTLIWVKQMSKEAKSVKSVKPKFDLLKLFASEKRDSQESTRKKRQHISESQFWQ